MQIKTPLGAMDFSDEELRANARSELTPAQQQRLADEVQQQFFVRLHAKSRVPRFISLFVTGTFFLALLNNPLLRANSTFMLLTLLITLVMASVWLYPYLDGRRTQARDRLHLLLDGAFTVETYEGRTTFVIIPQPTEEGYHDTYAISAGEQFPVSHELWLKLRPYADNLRLYYVYEPFLALLSAEPVREFISPADVDLEAVIGIGDDGELIFEEQDDMRAAAPREQTRQAK